jgi:DMSO/TMAO reductase YedYZ heme-binding membrane subunit
MDESRKRVIGIMAAILATLHTRAMICLELRREALEPTC